MSGEKTEAPTPKRIRDAKEKEGQFLVSREIISGSILVLGVMGLYFAHEALSAQAHVMVIHATQAASGKDFARALTDLLLICGQFVLIGSSAAVGACVVGAITTSVAQTGVTFSVTKLTQGLSAMSPLSNVKQIFSGRNLTTFLMNIFKLVALLLIFNAVVRGFAADIFAAAYCGLDCVSKVGGLALITMFGITAALYFPVATIDWLIQRWLYLKQLRMSIQEVKEEFKEMEGNPEIKAKRRQIHQETLNEATKGRVRKASFVVKNPTHYAVAMLHDDTTPAPMVVGKGEGALALDIIRIAEEEGIPIYENVQLAQTLYADIEVGRAIGVDLIEPIVEALRFVERLKAARGGR